MICTRYGTGGAEMNAQMIGHRLRLRGYETTSLFIASNTSDVSIPPDHVKVFSWRYPPNYFSYLIGSAKLFVFLLRQQPDVAIGFHPLANIIGSIACFCMRKSRFIGTQRNPSMSQSAVTKWLDKQLGRTRAYAANIAVSHAVLNSYRSYPKSYLDKSRVIHNGLDLPSKKIATKATSRRVLGLPEGAYVVGTLGRLCYQKNQEFLIRLTASAGDFLLALAGEGESEQLLKRQVADLNLDSRVIFLGNLAGDDVSHFYNAVDVFLLPSHYEGFGRTLVEAMDHNVPILANDLEVTREVLGEYGMYASLDEKLWMRIISDLKASAPVKNGKKRADLFRVDRMIDGYEEEILSAMSTLK